MYSRFKHFTSTRLKIETGLGFSMISVYDFGMFVYIYTDHSSQLHNID